MGKIIVTTNATLDGVIQDPDGAEGFRYGGWFGQFGGKDLEEWAKVETAEALGAEALLLGRRSDEWFAARWASRSGEWADKLNSMPSDPGSMVYGSLIVSWCDSASRESLSCPLCSPTGVFHSSAPDRAFSASTYPSLPPVTITGTPSAEAEIGDACRSWSSKSFGTAW